MPYLGQFITGKDDQTLKIGRRLIRIGDTEFVDGFTMKRLIFL